MAETADAAECMETAEAVAGWTAVLESMERITDAAASLLQQHTGENHERPERPAAGPPATIPLRTPLPGPMPAEVRQQARELAARQETLIRQLEQARLDVARQLQAVSSVPGIGEPAAAVYLDVKG